MLWRRRYSKNSVDTDAGVVHGVVVPTARKKTRGRTCKASAQLFDAGPRPANTSNPTAALRITSYLPQMKSFACIRSIHSALLRTFAQLVTQPITDSPA